MNCMWLIGAAALAAVASAQTFVNPQVRQSYVNRHTVPTINTVPIPPTGREQQPLYQVQNDGIHPQFNGPRPQGGQLNYNFKHDFKTLINPRNPQSDWRWACTSPKHEYVADGGTFLREGFSSIDLVSLPVSKFVSSKKGRLAGLQGYEAVVVNKQNFTVLEGQKLTTRFTFACDLFNEEDSPYPNNVVSNDDDDPTLINCGISLGSYGDSAFVFSIVATDEGIWGVYERNRVEMYLHPERSDKDFTIFHKIGKRKSAMEIIDGGVQYDREQDRVNYLINNEIVWYVDKIGMLPPNEPGTKAFTATRPDLSRVVEPSQFQVWFGLYDYLDQYDPNSGTPGIRKQRLVDGDNYYDPGMQAYDEVGKRENSLWGQGAVQTLYDVQIKLTGTGVGNKNETRQ